MLWMAVALGLSQPPADAGIREALESLAWEPDCSSVVEVALESGGKGGIASERRARLAALLPKIRFTVDKSFENDKSFDQGGDGDVSLAIDTDDDLELRGTVEWDLALLVYNPAESSLAARRLEEARWRLDLAMDVVSAYHERKTLLVLGRLGAIPEPEIVQAEMRIAELTALLDALTAGWFAKEIEKRRKLLWGG